MFLSPFCEVYASYYALLKIVINISRD